MMLVDLETVKLELKVDDDVADDLIVSQISRASALVLGYMKADPDDYDPDSTESLPVPDVVQHAIIVAVQEMFDGNNPLSETVKNLLIPFRDPTIT